MHYCQFETGIIVIGVETPEKLQVNDKFAAFLTEGKTPDITVKFDYTDEIAVSGEVIKSGDRALITRGENCIFVYYHLEGSEEFYAMRKVADSEPTVHNIYIPEKYRGKIWTRLVFDLIDFGDIAEQFGAVVFHSSFIEYNGEAILFTAPCGTGKSTQADLWEKFRNAEIINGDKSLLYVKDGVCCASGLPFSGSSGICKNKKMPVKAVVRLSQAKVNTISRLSGFGAYKAVYEGCYQSAITSVHNRVAGDIAEKFAVTVPVLSLACLPDSTAVDVLDDFLKNL